MMWIEMLLSSIDGLLCTCTVAANKQQHGSNNIEFQSSWESSEYDSVYTAAAGSNDIEIYIHQWDHTSMISFTIELLRRRIQIRHGHHTSMISCTIELPRKRIQIRHGNHISMISITIASWKKKIQNSSRNSSKYRSIKSTIVFGIIWSWHWIRVECQKSDPNLSWKSSAHGFDHKPQCWK